MEISEIESPFKPLMAEGDGSPKTKDLIAFDDPDQDLMEFATGDEVFEGKGICINTLGIIPSGSDTNSNSCSSGSNLSSESILTGSSAFAKNTPTRNGIISDGRSPTPTGLKRNFKSNSLSGSAISRDLCRKVLFQSPVKIGSPNALSESSFTSSHDKSFSTSGGITAETYFGSLFSICDTDQTGLVRVSKLLEMLMNFQALEEDDIHSTSITSSDSQSDSLEILKDILDPNDENPCVTLEIFKKSLNTFVKLRANTQNNNRLEPDSGQIDRSATTMEKSRLLERSNNNNLGRNKVNGNVAESGSMGNGSKWSLQNSPQRTVFGSESRPSLLDLSHLSSRSGSFEAVGGNSSVLDPWDLQTEISELRFQLQKLNDENLDLKEQFAQSQDENLLFMSQKDDLEKRLSHRDLAQERIKQLQREIEDARHTISSGEDLNCVLSTRIHRLERDYSELESKNEDLKRDYEGVTADLEKCLSKVKQKDEEIEKVKSASEEVVKGWIAKEKWLEDKLNNLNETLDELTKTNNQLRKEKLELECTLVDICGNHLAQLNGTNDENVEMPSSPGNEEEVHRSCLSKSLQAEIAATMEKRRSGFVRNLSFTAISRRESVQLVDASTQSEKRQKEVEVDESGKKLLESQYLQLFTLLKDSRELIFQGSSDKAQIGAPCTDAEPDPLAVVGSSATENITIEGKGGTEEAIVVPPNNSASLISVVGGSIIQEEIARRINEELAEFRQQLLKNSQDLYHAMQSNGSASAISMNNVTQSCPILAASDVVVKPKLVCCSTQTESSVIDQQPRRSSTQQDGPIRSLLDAIDDIDNEVDGNYLDKLSDDVSYRLTINLPTVLEESEQETETSPGAGPRRMSSCDKPRKRLVRMPNATEDESDSGHHKGDDDEAFKSDNDYISAASSLPGSVSASAYNSLERPLQITGAYGSHRNGDSDTASLVSASDGNTTYGSPISSPSSPTYWTPSQGSSSQETITNHDGDKTPVNEGDPTERYEVASCPGSNSRTEFENGATSLRKRGSSWVPALPMFNRHEISSCGVIPESQKEHMIKYAFDPVSRASEKDATILTGAEWRTLRKDLNKKDQDNYRKRFAQEEGNDVEGGSAIDSGSQRPYNSTDLEDEAEEYLESFPNLVEQLFKNLDILKERERGPSEEELDEISKRFNHLAFTFNTEHITLEQRIDLKFKEHDNSRSRMQDIITSLSDSLQRLEDISKSPKVPEEIVQLSSSLKHVAGDLDMHSNNLSRTSRRVGMMDVQIRLYKMIEVMVLYVHILRNLYDNVEKDFQNARKLLVEHNITFSSCKPAAKLNNNNNNNGKDSREEGSSYEGQSQRDEDGRPRQILQHLLGPKKSNVGLDYKLREELVLKEKKSSTNVIIRYIADTYEALRCELFWPWNWDETWRGIKQGFSIILMLVGLFIIFQSVCPIVSANSRPQPMVADLASIFSKHGDLNHAKLPPV